MSLTSHAQTTYTFLGASSTWGSTSANNWGLIGFYPGLSTRGNSVPPGTSSDVARFTGSTNLPQINFNTTGNGVGDQLTLGAILLTSASGSAWTLNANSSVGTLAFTGTTFDGESGVILAHTGSTALLWTISTGTGMSLALSAGNNTVLLGQGTSSTLGNTLTISADILAGAGSLTVRGRGTSSVNPGMLTLSGSSGFTGGITIGNTAGTNAGRLVLGSINSMPSSGDITVNTHSQLLVTSALSFDRTTAIHLNGSGLTNGGTLGALRVQNNVALSNTINLQASSIIATDAASGRTLTLNGDITESGGARTLTFAGGGGASAGTLSLFGESGFSGGLVLSATSGGIVRFNTDASMPAAGTITVNTGSQVQLGTGTYASSIPIRIAGTGPTTIAGAISTTTAIDATLTNSIVLTANASVAAASSSSVTLSGAISGSFVLTKSGVGNVTLTNAGNSFAASVISGGRLSVGSDAHLGAVPVSPSTNITFNGGTLVADGTSPITVHANRSVLLNSASGTVETQVRTTIAGAISGSVEFAKTGAETLVLTNSANSFSVLAIREGTLAVPSIVTPNTSNQPLGNSSSGITIGGSSTTGTLEYIGSAPATLQRTILIGGAGGAVIRNSGSGALSITTATVVGGSGGPMTVEGAGSTSISGAINTSATSLTKSGLGTLTLSGANTFNGPMYINGGEVSVSTIANVGATQALGASSNVSGGLVFGGNSTLRLTTTSSSVSSTKGATLSTSFVGTILVQNSTTNITLSGPIVGGGGLRKSGPGTLTLSGASNYSGSTTVNQGILTLSSSSSNNPIASSSRITVQSGSTLRTSPVTAPGGFQVPSGQTLGGNGTVEGTTGTTILSGGTLAPGEGAGTLTFSTGSSLTLQTGATLEIELDSPSPSIAPAVDRVNMSTFASASVSGATLSLAPLNSAADYFSTGGGAGVAGISYTLVDQIGAAPASGPFAALVGGVIVTNLNEGGVFDAAGARWQITYQGGANANDIVITTVPEPASVLWGVFATTALLSRRRRAI